MPHALGWGGGGWKSVGYTFVRPPPTLGAGVANSDMKHGLTHKGAWRLSASFVERMFYTHYRNVRKAMSNPPHAKPRDSQSHAKLTYRKCDCRKLSVQLDRDVNGTRTAAFVFAPGPALCTSTDAWIFQAFQREAGEPELPRSPRL